jgi:hypothetical protein
LNTPKINCKNYYYCNPVEEYSYYDMLGKRLTAELIPSSSISSQNEPRTQLLYDESVHLSREEKLRWCSPVKHFALSRRRSRVQIPAGAFPRLLVFQTFAIISTTATIMTEFYQKAVKKVKILDHKTTANPTGKWVSIVKG